MACWLSSTQLLWSFHWSCGLVKERASAAAAKAKPRFTVKVPWRVDVAQEASSTQVIDAIVMSCYVTLMLQDLWNDSHCNPSNYRILDVTCRAGWCFQTLPAFSKLPLSWGAVVFWAIHMEPDPISLWKVVCMGNRSKLILVQADEIVIYLWESWWISVTLWSPWSLSVQDGSVLTS